MKKIASQKDCVSSVSSRHAKGNPTTKRLRLSARKYSTRTIMRERRRQAVAAKKARQEMLVKSTEDVRVKTEDVCAKTEDVCVKTEDVCVKTEDVCVKTEDVRVKIEESEPVNTDTDCSVIETATREETRKEPTIAEASNVDLRHVESNSKIT
ncbi:uncharacterized protein LOC143211035 [Lasioglossum baleicum]|uniref:uncharacterized protein LOC143211035 n=1 Tax=Lasioglossum baleicum TaxID=434251 RepID=UPI003FCD686B